MCRFIFIAMLVFVSAQAHAENRVVTIRGIVDWGTDTSSIHGSCLMPICIFDTRSNIANKVLSACGYYEECEIMCRIDEYNNLLNIYKIHKINTQIEPSSAVILGAASWAAGIRGDINSENIGFCDLYISNFYSYRCNSETCFVFKFKLVVFEKHTTKKLGSGKVRLVKRGGKWHYFR